MVVRLRSVVQQIHTYLAASARFQSTGVGEPKSVASGIHAAVFMGPEYTVPYTTLTGTVERREVTVRLYRDALAEPREQIEFELDEAVSELAEDFLTDYDLGGVRNIDVTGMHTRWGYQTVDQKMQRIVDLVVPLIVDDNALFAP